MCSTLSYVLGGMSQMYLTSTQEFCNLSEEEKIHETIEVNLKGP